MPDILIGVENLAKRYHIRMPYSSLGLTGWENIYSNGAERIIVKDGENFLIASCTEDFLAVTRRVLREAGINQELRQNGRRLVEAHYDWRKIYPVWEAIDAR